VSITISKNVPVLENCKSQDVQGVPQDLQQLFGGFPGFVSCDNGSQLQDIGGGSGFIISKDGLILTNKHVVADEGASYTVLTNDGKKYSARVLARDPVQDLAIIKIDASNLSIVTLGNSDGLELGQTAIAIGNSLGEFRNTVSVGVISGLGRSITAVGDTTSETIQGVVQTDAAINPGNSGGPLIDLHGEVIGVNVATAQGAQSISFALPINWAKHDIQTVLSGGQIKAPYLGVRYTMLSASLADQKKLDVTYGALLEADKSGVAVVKDSPADKAGLKAGDVILSINGDTLEGKDLGQIIQNKNSGDKLRFDVFRDKRTISIDVTLAERG
jgi:S1-C subfamily serine protease